MANREAIRELQARLASRLAAAREEGLAMSWLAVRAGGLNLLFPLAQSGEIFSTPGVHPVPYAQPWFRGVVNLRGGLYGVVDLARFLAVDAGMPAAAAEAAPTQTMVVTFSAALDVNCAVLVDGLAGLRNAESFSAVTAPAGAAAPYLGNLFTDAGGARWQEINLQTLSQLPRFLNITA